MTETATDLTVLPQTEREEAPAQHATSLTLTMDVNSMDKMLRVAEIMAAGRATVPKHLQNNVPDCLAVTMQAMTWGMSPFVVAQKTHLVNGTLGYEAQLVNAVVTSSGSITGRFHYEYEGKSPNLSCRVGAIPRGESYIVWGMWISEKDVTTKNSPLWKTNPEQQLGYLQVKNWSRLYSPGAILGVYTPDEIETFKQPKNMGMAEVVTPTPSDELFNQAETAANGGPASYQKFWQETGKDNRKLLATEHERLKQVAADVDKNRTVETPSDTVEEITDADVLAKINSAKNEDALNVAADLINAITDNAAASKLNARYDVRLAEIRGEA